MDNKKKEREELRTTLLHKLLHNPTVLLAPVIVVAILLTPLAGKFNPVAIWNDRSYDVLSLLTLLGPFVAAVGAWEGARAGRFRKRSGKQSIGWTRQVTTWAKTAVWGLLFYLLLWAVVFVITATQATWGGPLLGPPLVGAVAILSLSAPVIGLPGAPVQADQRPPEGKIGDQWQIVGKVLIVPPFAAHASDWADQSFLQRESTEIAIGLVTDTPVERHLNLTTTRQAIALYLLGKQTLPPILTSCRYCPRPANSSSASQRNQRPRGVRGWNSTTWHFCRGVTYELIACTANENLTLLDASSGVILRTFQNNFYGSASISNGVLYQLLDFVVRNMI